MNVNTTAGFITYLSSVYSDGLPQFKKDGGAICVIPDPSRDIVLYHPDLPDNIKKTIEKTTKETIGEKVPHIILSNTKNHPNMDDLFNFIRNLDPYISFSISPAATVITAVNHNIDSDIVRRLKEYCETAPGLHLTYIMTKQIPVQVKGLHWRCDQEEKGKNTMDDMKNFIDRLENL